MKKLDRDIFYHQMETILTDYDDRVKIEFIKNFMKDKLRVDDFENTFINLDRMGTKTLMLLFVALIMEYENSNQNSKKYLKYDALRESSPYVRELFEEKMGKIKKLEKDTCYQELEVEDIFPIDEFTSDEIEFIEKILDKIHIDLEYQSDLLISTKQLIHLLTGIIREYDNDKKSEIELHNGKNG